MATGRDVVEGALKLLGVLAAGETASSTDATEGVNELNKMAAAWQAKNVYTGWIDITINDDFPLEAMHQAGVEAMLAVHLQPLYGNPLTPYCLERAKEGWNLLFADYHKPELLRTDAALQNMGSLGWPWRNVW